jgi:hypothetical protein
METTIKCLMGVEFFEISDKYIYELRQKHINQRELFGFLPKYTLNLNEGQHNQPIFAEYYHQFMGSSDSHVAKYWYFDLKPLDNQLEYELGYEDIEKLFKDYDFKKILSNFTPHSDDDISHHVIPQIHYLIVEMIYTGGGKFDDDDFDLEIKITGYLNKDLQPIYF